MSTLRDRLLAASRSVFADCPTEPARQLSALLREAAEGQPEELTLCSTVSSKLVLQRGAQGVRLVAINNGVGIQLALSDWQSESALAADINHNFKKR